MAKRINGDTAGYYEYADIAFNGDGSKGLAVWQAFNGINYQAMYSFYSGGSWSENKIINGEISSPRVESNGSDFMMVYLRGRGIYARPFNGDTLGAETLLQSLEGVSTLMSPDILSNGGDYCVFWAQEHRSHDGQMRPYACVHSWEPPAWSKATLIEPGNGTVAYMCGASNETGYCIAWIFHGGGPSCIHANIHDGSAWGANASLVNSSAASVDFPAIASDNSGYCIAWRMNDGSHQSIYASFYNGSTWSAETTVESASQDAWYPTIASNGTGYCVAWSQYGGSSNSLHASVHNGLSWGDAATIIEAVSDDDHLCQTMGSNGDGYLISWTIQEEDQLSLYANMSTALAEAWNGPVLVKSGIETSTYASITNKHGDYALIWNQKDELGNSNIFTGVYSGSGWGSEEAIVDAQIKGMAAQPCLTTNNSGTAMAVWNQYHSGRWNMYACTGNDGSWGLPFNLAENIYRSASSQAVATTGSDFMAVYSINADVYARFYNGETWEDETKLFIAPYSTGIEASIASNGSGYCAAWLQWDSDWYIYCSVYNGTTWVSSPVESITGYTSGPLVCSNGEGYCVIWRQLDGIHAVIYDKGSWEGCSTVLDPGLGSEFMTHAIASNGTGYGVVWTEVDGFDQNIYCSIHDGSAWGEPMLIEPGLEEAENPSIASDGAGYCVVWQQHENGFSNIFSSMYNVLEWSGETIIDAGVGDSTCPFVASTGAGYGAVWIQVDDACPSVFASIHNGDEWQTPFILENIDIPVQDPAIFSRNGGYSAIWLQADPDNMEHMNEVWGIQGFFSHYR
ncbi:MAG TPA: hypothetical protein PK926_02810 [Spirochaetota bacterium]|nr:hypothetical protein [Spirochaetota bacterium]